MTKSIIIDNVEIRPIDDGLTHINVYSNAKTELGRWLSNFSVTWTETNLGKFASLEGYYHYRKALRVINPETVESDLAILINRLKAADGFTAKLLGNKIRKTANKYGLKLIDLPDEAFNKDFEEALFNKVTSDLDKLSEYFDEISSGTIFVHYYNYGGEVMYKPHFKWLIERLESIQPRLRIHYENNVIGAI